MYTRKWILGLLALLLSPCLYTEYTACPPNTVGHIKLWNRKRTAYPPNTVGHINLWNRKKTAYSPNTVGHKNLWNRKRTAYPPNTVGHIKCGIGRELLILLIQWDT